MRGWRGIGIFWAALLLLAGGAAATLQYLGPPPNRATPATAPATTPAPPTPAPPAPAPPAPDHPAPGHPPPDPATPQAANDPPRPAQPPRGIAPPDPALLERSPNFQGAQLPRLAPDGRAPRTAYAAPAPQAATPGAPRVALLLSGFGQSDKDSRAALDALPGPVSLAVSAYAAAPPRLFDDARASGHELLGSLPMEPQNFPINDAGPRQLLTGLPPEDNRTNLEWALGRLPGEVGMTSASDGMRGERFADVAGAFDPVLDEVARRGLLFVDARPGRTIRRPNLWSRGIDVVIDDPPARAEIDAKLAALERLAREKGSAIGLAGPPRPVTVEKLAAWVAGLQARGILLVPVSSLVKPPS